jgi:hypothetical protein
MQKCRFMMQVCIVTFVNTTNTVSSKPLYDVTTPTNCYWFIELKNNITCTREHEASFFWHKSRHKSIAACIMINEIICYFLTEFSKQRQYSHLLCSALKIKLLPCSLICESVNMLCVLCQRSVVDFFWLWN